MSNTMKDFDMKIEITWDQQTREIKTIATTMGQTATATADLPAEYWGMISLENLYVGYHKEFDYNIPRNLGIQSFYLDRRKASKGEFIVYDLIEFEERINKI